MTWTKMDKRFFHEEKKWDGLRLTEGTEMANSNPGWGKKKKCVTSTHGPFKRNSVFKGEPRSK